MQSQLASGYVGQSLKLAVGKMNLSARVAYIDSPSSHSHATLSTRHKHGIDAMGSTYWPGAHNGRLVLSHFPRVGPLSHPHYLVKKHSSKHQKKPDHHLSDIPPSSDAPQAVNAESSEATPQEAHHTHIEPQYITTTRGQLLPMKEYGKYHESRQRGATYVFQAPQPFLMNSAKRSLIETDKPVIAADNEMRLVNTTPKMIVAGYEGGFLKSQRRANDMRISGASKDLYRDILPTSPTAGARVDPVARLEQLLIENFGQESFSIEDLISLQRIQSNKDHDPYYLFPPLTQQDLRHYEANVEGLREALEERWNIVFPVGGQGPTHPLLYRLWPKHTRDHLTQIVSSFHLARRPELLSMVESLKNALKEARKGIPSNRGSNKRTSTRKSSTPSPITESTEETTPTPISNETWPLSFDEGASTSTPPTINIDSLGDSKTTRSIILALALYSTSTNTHPLPANLVKVICSHILQPLGYGAHPTGAQVLLTHLGMPVTDPIDIPFLFNLPKDATIDSMKLSKSYPWLKSNEHQSLPEYLGRLAENENSPYRLSLDAMSPRQQTLKSSSDLSPDMSLRASAIFSGSLSTATESISPEAEPVLQQITTASKSPTFHFSSHSASVLERSSIALPASMSDSSTMLSSLDLDKATRVDLSALPSYAIDDKSTTEVDDAFALDAAPLLPHADWILNHLNDYLAATSSDQTTSAHNVVPPPSSLPKTAKVYIHIADPTTVMRVGDPLEMGARQRVETMYLPQRKSFMLPSLLSEFYCSLLPGAHKNLGLTFEANINILTGALESMEVFPSKFSGMQRFDYEAVQSCLSGAGSEEISSKDALALKLLGSLAKARTRWRFDVGKASTMQLAALRVRFESENSNHQISLVSENKNADSRSLVEEMMVLVGEITGKMSLEHGFAVPYRTLPSLSNVHLPSFDLDLALATKHNPLQPTFESVMECDISRKLLVHNLQSLNLRSSSDTSATPAEHRALGLPIYARASSPLRRYADVVAHMQLKAWRRHGGDLSKMPYSSALVHRLSHHINSVAKDIKYTQKTSERWWKQQFVLRHGMDRTWDALVFTQPDLAQLSVVGGINAHRAVQYSLYILEVDLIVFLPTPFPLAEGQIVKLKPTATSEITLEWSVLEPVAL